MPDLTPDQPLTSQLGQLRALIQDTWIRVLRSADAIQVQTCWQVGRHIVEFEQGGAARATYGEQLIPRLAQTVTAEFGKGFDARSLLQMRQFYQSFPILNALRPQLSWTNYRMVLPSEGKLRQELDRERQALTERRSDPLEPSEGNLP